jgi:hypothetical protein
MKRFLLFFLLLCLPAFGAYTTYNVWAGATGSGDGSTMANAYTSLGAAVTAHHSGDTIFECSNIGTGSTPTNDTAVASVSGFAGTDDVIIQSTDKTYKMVVADATILTLTNTTSNLHVTLSNLYIETTSPTAHNRCGISISTMGVGTIKIHHCTIKGHGSGTYYQAGIRFNDANSTLQMWDCLIYNIGTYNSASECGINLTAYSTASIYNCTIVGGHYGIAAAGGTVVCKNCIFKDAATASWYDDGTATSSALTCYANTAGVFDTETGSVENAILTAFSATYRLTAGNPCIAAGLDLRADATINITDDIDAVARAATPCVGCSEYAAAGGGPGRFRRAIRW